MSGRKDLSTSIAVRPSQGRYPCRTSCRDFTDGYRICKLECVGQSAFRHDTGSVVVRLDHQESSRRQVVLQPFGCHHAVLAPVLLRHVEVEVEVMTDAGHFPQVRIFIEHEREMPHEITDKDRVAGAEAVTQMLVQQ